MFFVVPKGRSLIKSVSSFEHLSDAKTAAIILKEQSGENYDIINHERMWTTQTFDEAHMLSLDVPHMGRD